MSEQSNEDWMLEQIANAQSMDRLEYLAELIDYDKWEPAMEYTKDEAVMDQVRAAWVKRKREM